MRTRRRSLPHPVLSPWSDDVEPNIFAFQCDRGDITTDMSRWRIVGQIEHQNDTLGHYIDRGAAAYGIHVECPRTFFRKWYPQQGKDVTVEIPAGLIAGRVELSAFCVAVSDIAQYKIAGQHSDYQSADFSISRGDVLAYAETVEFDAYLDIDPIRKISSILDVIKSQDRVTGSALIFFDRQRIEIELSQKDHQSYVDLRSDPTNKGVVASNIVFPAILQALNFLQGLGEDGLETAKAEMRWCRSLVAKLESNGFSLDTGTEELFKAAQEILKEPVRRGLGDLLTKLTM
jgi:hypothetical protein